MKTAEYNQSVVNIHMLVLCIRAQITWWGTADDKGLGCTGPGDTGSWFKRTLVEEGMLDALGQAYKYQRNAINIQ